MQQTHKKSPPAAAAALEEALAKLPPFSFSTVYSTKLAAAAAPAPSQHGGRTCGPILPESFRSKPPASVNLTTSWFRASPEELHAFEEQATVYFQHGTSSSPCTTVDPSISHQADRFQPLPPHASTTTANPRHASKGMSAAPVSTTAATVQQPLPSNSKPSILPSTSMAAESPRSPHAPRPGAVSASKPSTTGTATTSAGSAVVTAVTGVSSAITPAAAAVCSNSNDDATHTSTKAAAQSPLDASSSVAKPAVPATSSQLSMASSSTNSSKGSLETPAFLPSTNTKQPQAPLQAAPTHKESSSSSSSGGSSSLSPGIVKVSPDTVPEPSPLHRGAASQVPAGLGSPSALAPAAAALLHATAERTAAELGAATHPGQASPRIKPREANVSVTSVKPLVKLQPGSPAHIRPAEGKPSGAPAQPLAPMQPTAPAPARPRPGIVRGFFKSLMSGVTSVAPSKG